MYSYEPSTMQKHEQEGGGTRYVATGDRMMIMLLELHPGAVVPLHSHPHEQAGIVIEGEFDFIIGTERRRVKPGDMYIIPGGVPHQAIGSDRKAVFMDVWSPPREVLLD